ncbi:sortase domain-containing protein [Streptomyces sp. NBC_00370]|uniref:sortase domain-containing protein n=1 Tax=Streptomyces sp. NBC_00370 TaxID=2975728 RepID=UPI002E275223
MRATAPADTAIKVLLAVAGLCAVGAVLLQLFVPRPAPPQAPVQPAAEPRQIRVTDAHSVPVKLHIPSLGVDADILPLGLDATGALEVPGFRNPMRVGWYALGPRPGQRGPAVLVGHRDAPANEYEHGKRIGGNHLRKGVFAKIGRLHDGARIEAELGDGRRLPFRVTSVETYRTRRFPTARVYGPVDQPQLRLITCGGVIDAQGHWDSNVVVSAVQVAAPTG